LTNPRVVAAAGHASVCPPVQRGNYFPL